ncbi:Queuosine precursor ECF transporter S component QueT [Clostridium sp. N3C]|uniref:QueT transporter family protein n=1 Tax=Clostridium sp. N3C TaxID=1776758 RepID=UPI00092DF079|nr:QueT transporter family protein [Clostridium sp. N3C]NLZ35783.1 QueT transporter family protein [Clostridiales bacterium]SCN21411.1 Queuosine precursor ECF transporter S component QueT [Clostridium sp. N3C]
MKLSIKQLCISAMIAAIYASLTIMFSFMSYSNVQYRLAEALTILPIYSPIYIIGLFIGCILSNLQSTLGPIDIVLGSLTTLVAATITYFIGKSNLKYKKFLIPLPAVILNALVVGVELHVLIDAPLALGMLQVGWGEFVCAYILGLLLMKFIDSKRSLKRLLTNN